MSRLTQTLLLSVATIAILSSASAVRAEFALEGVPASPVLSRQLESPPGAPMSILSPAAENVSGFGKDLPLSVAVRSILPKNRKAAFGSGVTGNEKVTWSPGPWKDVVDNAAKPHGIDVIDDGLTVSFSKAAALHQPVPEKKWAAAAGKTLHQTLDQWASESGWRLVWNKASAKDRQFSASADFSGDFEAAATELLSLYTEGQSPIRAEFHHSNNVLEVWGAGGRLN